jgi:hypothetical protein
MPSSHDLGQSQVGIQSGGADLDFPDVCGPADDSPLLFGGLVSAIGGETRNSFGRSNLQLNPFHSALDGKSAID